MADELTSYRDLSRPAEVIARSVVALGSFNPAIFQPAWFASLGLLGEADADAARADLVVLPQLTRFALSWLDVQITQERFQMVCAQEHMFGALRDLVLGTFRTLSHTPINRVGLNHDAHFSISSEERWHEIGHALVPKAPWGEVLLNPGTRSVLLEGQRPDEYAGAMLVRVEPSLQIQPGLYVNTNDDFLLTAEKGAVVNSEPFLELVENEWDASKDRALRAIEAALTIGRGDA